MQAFRIRSCPRQRQAMGAFRHSNREPLQDRQGRRLNAVDRRAKVDLSHMVDMVRA